MTTLLGRRKELRHIAELHAKPVPDHISVVGPRAIGKSALLRSIHDLHAVGSSVFACAAFVDLRHDPPGAMEGVLARVAIALKSALRTTSDFNSVAEYITTSDSLTDLNDQLNVAIGEVAEAGRRVLLLLDGCDPILQNSAIPRNLWDNLRALAQSKGLRLMTATRLPLHELCYNPDSLTSDFFRIFYDQPTALGAFDDDDWLATFASIKIGLDASAQKEIRNWTGGHPDLVEQVLERLQEGKKTQYSKPDVDAAAESMAEQSARVDVLWSECPEETRRDVVALLNGDVAVTEIPEPRLRYLTVRGLAARTGGKVRLSNRLLERKAATKKNDVSGIRELFGTREAFDANIPKLLELRLAGLTGVDVTLTRIVLRCVRDLAEDPSACLSGARDILDRALDLVWRVEAPDMRSQNAWVVSWRLQPSRAATGAIERAGREPEIPEERGLQCDILRTITGRQGLRSVARKTSKATCVLIEHMKQVGDLKNHGKIPPGNGLALAFCLAAIELCEALARDGL